MTLNNRDSHLLWVGAGVALITYLIGMERPPTEWNYKEWLQFGAATFAFIMGKLQTSPLKGEYEK